MKREFTEKQRLANRRMYDPRVFLEEFTKIKGKTAGHLIKFKLNEAQKDLFNTLKRYSRVIILKARQLGFSTGVVGYFYHRTVYMPSTNTALIGYNSELTAELLDKTKTLWRTTPDALRPSLRYNSRYELSFPILDSKIIVLPASKTVGRGYTLHNCLAGDTKVAMADGTWKDIQNIFEGDYVIDGDGKPNKVVVVDEKKTTRTMYMITVMGRPGSIKLTNDHKILIRRNDKATLVKAENVQVGDLLAAPKGFYEDDVTDDTHGWAPITHNMLIPTIPEVYDISLENAPRTFMTECGIVSNCLATEAAFWDDAEEKLAILEASVPQTGKLVIETTPSTVGTAFHRKWSTPNNYAKKEYGWWWGYNKKEIDLVRSNMADDLRYFREYELEFDSTGMNVFPRDIIRAQRQNVRKVGENIDMGGGKFWPVQTKAHGLRVYRPPQTGVPYVISADIAEGVEGGDYSVAVVFDKNTGEEVAFWRGHCAPDKFGELLNIWGRYYNSALMIPEVNNHGLTTVTILKQKAYPNMYFRPQKFDIPGMDISRNLAWKTTMTTRPILIDDFAKAVRNQEIIIRSKELLDEMMVFVYNKQMKPVAEEGFHDDVIMAAAIGVQGLKQVFTGDTSQINYDEHMPMSSPY